MKIVEYQQMLVNLYTTHGNLECTDSNNHPIGPPEFSDDLIGELPRFVLAAEA